MVLRSLQLSSSVSLCEVPLFEKFNDGSCMIRFSLAFQTLSRF